MRDMVWLSYELGEDADYPGLYRFLQRMQARECGPNLASFFFEHAGDLPSELRQELEQSVRLTFGDRVYLIYKDPADGEMTGLFIIGQRQPAPWSAASC